MSIVLPERCGESARKRAAELGMSPEEYLGHLVQQDTGDFPGLTAEEQERLAGLLDEALDAPGSPIVPGPDFKEQIMREAREIVARGE